MDQENLHAALQMPKASSSVCKCCMEDPSILDPVSFLSQWVNDGQTDRQKCCSRLTTNEKLRVFSLDKISTSPAAKTDRNGEEGLF